MLINIPWSGTTNSLWWPMLGKKIQSTFINQTYFSLCSSSSVCPMGGNSSSSSSRLFGTLAQSMNSAPLVQPDPYTEESPDHDPDQDLAALDPDQLLRECEEALQRRPARPHRDLVYPAGTVPCHHKRNPSIRVMQWNILAQGRHLWTDHATVDL
uniref:Nocturnin n=1 Tax=Monopterus albus TaxID=43700 RepID=A0A3Q3J252_MONAL